MADYQEITDAPTPSIEKGFYYHYKHDPNGPFNNYSYEVLGVSRHTENRSLSMVYRPLYENTYLDVDYSNRPLDMALGTIEREGETIPRFRKIEDPEVIEKLRTIRDEMYPQN